MVQTERWVSLFAAGRAASASIAVVLLVVHPVTGHDDALVALIVIYGGLSAILPLARPSLVDRPVAWAIDAFVCLGFVLASEEWRSPFYLLLLSAIGPPAARLPLRRALQWGTAVTVGYIGVALITGLDVNTLRTTTRLDTFVTHILLPMVLTIGVAYAAEAFRRLDKERKRSERLAVEKERRRIAWELHDSAKQRLHAAALMLSAVEPRAETETGGIIASSLEQLRAATADMETSIAELRSPLEGRRLEVALRERARELAPLSDAEIRIRGRAPEMPLVPATHVYRIVAEAMTNAVKHAGATRVDVRLEADNGSLRALVEDDGAGMPDEIRPGAGGLLTMHSRAFAVGATLDFEPAAKGGTRVHLEVPLDNAEGGPHP